MLPQDFVLKEYSQLADKGEFSAQAPSNIALVKYWGKKDEQIPCNPSISFTLKKAQTHTKFTFEKRQHSNDEFDIEVYFEGKREKSFEPKIINFFQRIQEYSGFLNTYKIKIATENTFPHSSGIASSASAMASIAICIMEIEKSINPKMTNDYYYKKASFLARLGSGSACRSITDQVVLWGNTSDYRESSNYYGVGISDVHSIFKDFQDAILLVDAGKKAISSSQGHQLMHHHPYAGQRFEEAKQNTKRMLHILKEGNLDDFIKCVEKEALSLHAMMMTSSPYFILMQPNTLEIIQKIWTFRNETNIPICFTLDAGANVHLLYPKRVADIAKEFIERKLLNFCQNHRVIYDEIGCGANVIN
jgi:diphosphomevalonate decarboxylase